MPDTWVTPRIWVAGEKVTASKKNDESNNFRVLFPFTTGGAMAYRNPAGAYLTEFAIGAAGSILMSSGGIPFWGDGTRWIIPQLNADVVLAVGDGAARFVIPPLLNNWNISFVGAIRDSGGTGVPAFQLRNVTDGVDVLSTKVTIDSGEVHSGTAAAPPVIDTTKDDVQTWDRFAVDVDVAGTNTLYAFFLAGFTKP